MTSPRPLPSSGQQPALLAPNTLIPCMLMTAGVPTGCLGSWAGTLWPKAHQCPGSDSTSRRPFSPPPERPAGGMVRFHISAHNEHTKG